MTLNEFKELPQEEVISKLQIKKSQLPIARTPTQFSGEGWKHSEVYQVPSQLSEE